MSNYLKNKTNKKNDPDHSFPQATNSQISVSVTPPAVLHQTSFLPHRKNMKKLESFVLIGTLSQKKHGSVIFCQAQRQIYNQGNNAGDCSRSVAYKHVQQLAICFCQSAASFLNSFSKQDAKVKINLGFDHTM